MSQNIIDEVRSYFSDGVVQQTSTALGEDSSRIRSALMGLAPLVLGGVLRRAEQPGGSAEVFDMAQQAHSSGLLDQVGNLLTGDGGGWASRGTEFLRSSLGAQYQPATETIATGSGANSGIVSRLAGVAVPVVLGLLGRHAAQNNLDASGLSSWLTSQRASILGALPFGLGSLLGGVGGAASVAGAVRDTGYAARSVATETAPAAVRASRPWWPWLLLLLLGAGLLYYLFGRNRAEEPTTATTTTTVDTTTTAAAPVPAAPTGRYDEATGNYIYDTGANTDVKLPDGTVLQVGSNSTEARLFNFLNDASQTVSDDKTQGWMSLDRVYFDTGKATLTAASQQQLQNIAAILKAFPNAAIKLGGYTDNQGRADANLTLSADRANAARKAVMTNGIDAGRVAAEGYGQEHPLASNDTPEGRAQNRRVDVRVTKK
ncbi:OmpA family protein [Hymenobacter sp. 15J16-1T3B]|uniref:OmpA family protein n=1 Tax=Hymenobacter sp. 15J16-1T3B TaxID=2886941 RepID=UPI001D128F9B|nr:OmpA family protein [Hymenobacter sp. 15J16-1T3B]